MADQLGLIQEAAKRGILPADKKPLYDEAVKRGLIKTAAEPEKQSFLGSALQPFANVPKDISSEFQSGMDTVRRGMAENAEALKKGEKPSIGVEAEPFLGAFQAMASPVTGTARAIVGDPARAVIPQDSFGGRVAANTMEDLAGIVGPGPAAKALGVAGKAVAGPAAKALSESGKLAGNVAAGFIGGVGTHTGGDSLRQAAKAGYEGGQASQLFLEALRGGDPGAVVDTARTALAKMREARSAAYKSGMVDVTKDATHLNFDGVDKALKDIHSENVAEYEGKATNPEAATRLKEVEDAIEEWRHAEPDKFHTVAGFDALKQRIGAVLEQTTPHTKASVAVGRAYNAVRDEIAKQAPEYGKIMKDYEEASSALRDLEGGLSLKDTWARRGTTDQALHKLQKALRNEARNNYGNRLRQVSELDEASGGKIMPQLAGQALSGMTPRGLGSVLGGLNAYAGLSNPLLALGIAPFQSPRIMGEAAHMSGAAARKISELLRMGKTAEAQKVLDDLGQSAYPVSGAAAMASRENQK